MNRLSTIAILATLMTVAAFAQEAKPSASPTAPQTTTEQKLAIKTAQLNLANAQNELMALPAYQKVILANQAVQSLVQAIYATDNADTKRFNLDANLDFVEVGKPAAAPKEKK